MTTFTYWFFNLNVYDGSSRFNSVSTGKKNRDEITRENVSLRPYSRIFFSKQSHENHFFVQFVARSGVLEIYYLLSCGGG